MAEEYQDYSTVDMGTRLNEIEEKQRLLKNRILLIGENLITTKEDLLKTEIELKKSFKQLHNEIQSIKRVIPKILNELSNFARKPELEILERQMKMFEPLELARIKDVKELIRDELKNKTHKNK